MNIKLALFLFFLSFSMLNSSEYTHIAWFDGLALVKLNDKWGGVDKTDKIVIPIKYDYAEGFSEGLARVKLDGKYGFIDKTDKIVIPIKYEDASSFYGELAWVKLNNKYGFIDKTGRIVIPI